MPTYELPVTSIYHKWLYQNWDATTGYQKQLLPIEQYPAYQPTLATLSQTLKDHEVTHQNLPPLLAELNRTIEQFYQTVKEQEFQDFDLQEYQEQALDFHKNALAGQGVEQIFAKIRNNRPQRLDSLSQKVYQEIQQAWLQPDTPLPLAAAIPLLKQIENDLLEELMSCTGLDCSQAEPHEAVQARLQERIETWKKLDSTTRTERQSELTKAHTLDLLAFLEFDLQARATEEDRILTDAFFTLFGRLARQYQQLIKRLQQQDSPQTSEAHSTLPTKEKIDQASQKLQQTLLTTLNSAPLPALTTEQIATLART